MISKSQVVAGVLALSSLGALVPATAPAQHQPEASEHKTPSYDTTSEITVRGTIAEMKTAGELTGGGRSPVHETWLLLETGAGPIETHLGPAWFLSERRIELRKGEALEVTGSRVAIGGSQVILARELRRDDRTWALRDSSGRPLWTSNRSETRGFWTPRRVLFAGLIVKAALIAAMVF